MNLMKMWVLSITNISQRGNPDAVHLVSLTDFRNSLSKIYEDLCAYCGNPVARGPQQQKSLRLASLTEPPANTYDSLTVEEGHHYECEECTPRVSHPCPESSAAASSPCEAQGIEAQFAEDRLDTIIQVMAAVQVSQIQR